MGKPGQAFAGSCQTLERYGHKWDAHSAPKPFVEWLLKPGNAYMAGRSQSLPGSGPPLPMCRATRPNKVKHMIQGCLRQGQVT